MSLLVLQINHLLLLLRYLSFARVFAGAWALNGCLTLLSWRRNIASPLALFPLISRSFLLHFLFKLLLFFQLLLLSDHFVEFGLETFEARHVVLAKHIRLLRLQDLLQALFDVEFARS